MESLVTLASLDETDMELLSCDHIECGLSPNGVFS